MVAQESSQQAMVLCAHRDDVSDLTLDSDLGDTLDGIEAALASLDLREVKTDSPPRKPRRQLSGLDLDTDSMPTLEEFEDEDEDS